MHTVNKLTSFALFSLALGLIPISAIMPLACVVIFLSGLYANHQYYLLCKRLKWILISMSLIYIFTTPGQYVFNIDSAWNVGTIEGIGLAALHTLYLMTMLAAVALLLVNTTKEQFIAGLYQLGSFVFSPAHARSFVVRLWLVLNHTEQQPSYRLSTRHLISYLNNQTPHPCDDVKAIAITLCPYTMRDWLILTAMFCITGVVLYLLK